MKRNSLVVILAAALAASLAMAQYGRGVILGTVTDSSGAVLPGVKVAVRSLATNESREFTTDSQGSYQFTALLAGRYAVSASGAQFKTAQLPDVELRVNSQVRADIVMQLGVVSETVSVLGGLLGAAFQLGCTVLTSFGLAIGLLVAKIYEVDVPIALIIGATILGCLYFPMAFLAVAMKDSVLAANPLVVIPAILRMPGEYLVTAVLLVVVFGMRQLGNIVSSYAGAVSFTTKDMNMLLIALAARAAIAFINVYLLTVTMRMLGLLYNHKKAEFGWFRH